MITRVYLRALFLTVLALSPAALLIRVHHPIRARHTPVFSDGKVNSSLLERVPLKGFSEEENEAVRMALLPKLASRCGEAFKAARLRTPVQMFEGSGVVIQHSKYLYLRSARDLGLVYEETRRRYKDEFSTGRAQAGTVPATRSGRALTVDNCAHIYLHDSAFLGESFLSIFYGWLSLSDVLTHELIHAGGQPPTPGWLGPFTHDLAGYMHYNEIMEACR